MDIPGRTYFLDEIVLGDWFPRRGDNALFRFEKIASSGDADLTMRFLTKNTEETGDGDDVQVPGGGGEGYAVTLQASDDDGTIKQVLVTSVKSSETETKGFKELVRLKMLCVDGGTAGPSDWMLARIFPPIFFDEADATKVPARPS